MFSFSSSESKNSLRFNSVVNIDYRVLSEDLSSRTVWDDSRFAPLWGEFSWVLLCRSLMERRPEGEGSQVLVVSKTWLSQRDRDWYGVFILDIFYRFVVLCPTQTLANIFYVVDYSHENFNLNKLSTFWLKWG